jgi:large subunit ribosomal protein L5
MSRLGDIQDEAVPALMKQFGYKNVMAVPKMVKINVNMGLGEAIANAKILDVATEELSVITGQHPVVTKAKKSIALSSFARECPLE